MLSGARLAICFSQVALGFHVAASRVPQSYAETVHRRSVQETSPLSSSGDRSATFPNHFVGGAAGHPVGEMIDGGVSWASSGAFFLDGFVTCWAEPSLLRTPPLEHFIVALIFADVPVFKVSVFQLWDFQCILRSASAKVGAAIHVSSLWRA